jgi:alpha-L-fucosidase
VSDILAKYAKDAVIFQGKSANIRWVGNEDGYAPSPNWYTLKSSDLATGIATALHSDPNGNAYAPVETDVPLLKKDGHKWFWAPKTDHLLMDVGQFMTTYYKSVGRGGVLLLNSTPDTTGLIPETHVARYKLFGQEIRKRFSAPVKETSGIAESLEILFKKPTSLNHVILQEDLSKGQRVLSYIIEGYIQNKWIRLYEGSSVGNKKIDHFKTVEVEKIRVLFLKFKAVPQIKKFAVYNIQSELPDIDLKEQSVVIGNWQADTYGSEWKDVTFDLTSYVNAIGQYDISFSTIVRDFTKKEPSGLEFSDPKLEMYGRNIPEALQIDTKINSIRITRSQQTLDEFPTILKMKIRSKPTKSSGDITIKRLIFN